MKGITVLALAVAGILIPAFAQAINLPMTKSAVTPATLAEAVAKNDQAVLNVTGFEYIAAIQKFHPEVGTGGVQDYAEYLRNLEVRPLPQGQKFTFARVEKRGGWYDVNSFERMAKPKERGLYDRNIGKFIASADCGNVMKEPEMSVVEVPSSPAPQTFSPVVVVQQPLQLQPMPMFSQPSPVNFGRAYEDCPSGSSCGQAAWFAGKLIEAGGLIGYGAVLRPPQYTITNTNDVTSSSSSNADASASSSASSSARGGSVVVRPPADPNPPPGGGPVDPNPPY